MYENIVVVGDKILIKPLTESNKTKAGLYLPSGYSEKDEIKQGYVIKTGPGVPYPHFDGDVEPWKSEDNTTKYMPLQVKEGDLAFFLARYAYEIKYKQETLFVVSQHHILLVERDFDL